MVIYLDVYFAVNFLMNYLLLAIMGSMLPAQRYRGGRLLGAAMIGTVWSIGVILLQQTESWLILILTLFFVGSLMMTAAFGRCTLAESGKRLLIFWVLSILVGGFFELVGQSYIGRWPLSSFFAAVCGTGMLGRSAVQIIRSWLRTQFCICEVTLRHQGKEKKCMALWDTGNQLFEPYSHQPVHVVTSEVCTGLCDRITRVIYIPFSSVGTEHGVLPGIQIDEMEVSRGGKIIACYQNPWLAISRKPLSLRHQYEMLLHGQRG